MDIQIIGKQDSPEYAVIKWEDFLKISELYRKETGFDLLEQRREGKITEIPADMNPIKMFRLENGLSQQELADMLDVSQPYIAKLEKKEKISSRTMKKIENSVSKNNSLLKGIIKLFS